MATVLAARLPDSGIEGPGSLGAFRTVFRVGALVALIGGVAAQIIRDADAAPSMRPRVHESGRATKRPAPA
jgi:hypothetical protein